jgi:hypothetical protein
MENLEATHTGAIIQDSEHIVIEHAAGGDMFITENNFSEAPAGFSEINTQAYSEKYFIAPVFTGMLAEQLKDRRLLILSGGSGFDKNEFARYLSCLVAKEINNLPVCEWRNNEDADGMINQIREREAQTLFIVPDTIPQHVSYDLAQLASIVRQRNHFVLLTTEMTEATWQQPDAIIKLYWFAIPGSGLYSSAALGKCLIQKLNAHKQVFDVAIDVPVEAHTRLGGNMTPAMLAEHFESPEQIDFFLTLLEANAHAGSREDKIKEALFTIKDKSETLVTKWYRSLTPVERLIALGAGLLDGLYDDQFFAVMQQIVNDFWHHRDKHLQSLDYCDLDFLLNFFSFETFGDGRQILVCKFPNQRAEIIRAAWQSHKRHILSAFSVITGLAGSSSAQSSGGKRHAEINGTTDRGKRLRAVAAETISDVGIVSLQTAEPKLLELAASSDITTRRITAKAMARWRAFARDEQMYTTLSRWQISRSNSVRSTVVFTLKYAAEYDSPGHLDRRIMTILNEMSGDTAVVATMKDILPELIRNHAFHIQNDLRDYIAVEEAYSDIVAMELVALYATHPAALKELLEDWLNSCMEENSQLNRRHALTYRDNRLIVVLKVYRSLPYGHSSDVISLSYVWGLIDQLQHQEQRAAMRAFVMETAAFLISAQPEEAIRHIEPLFRKLGTEGRLTLIRSIAWIYLRQRAALPDGQYRIGVQGLSVPVWYSSKRPVTEIEIVLYGWLTGEQSFAREVATLAFIEFAVMLDQAEPFLTQQAVEAEATEQNERERNRQHREKQQQQQNQVVFPFMPELSLWTRIKIFFWLLFRTEQERVILREMLRTILMYKRTNGAYLAVVIQRWSRHPDALVQRMSWWLTRITGI